MDQKFLLYSAAFAFLWLSTVCVPVCGDGGHEPSETALELGNSAAQLSGLQPRSENARVLTSTTTPYGGQSTYGGKDFWSSYYPYYPVKKTLFCGKTISLTLYDCAKMNTETSSWKCCNQKCVDVLNDDMNCNFCSTPCLAGESCFKGKCVDTSKDPHNCGVEGKVCPLIDNKRTCINGVCVGSDGYY
jgi:hypothetical protein